jgi:predicted  nucleic acid-binding Zn-ribbon protein
MPDSVTNAMHKAAFDIWAAASTLAGESVERIQHEAGEAITKAKAELSEYAGEVSRLEQANIKAVELQKNVDEAQEKAVKITAENAGYVAKLQEKDSQLFSLKADYAKLQGELVEIAKAATATKQAPKRTTKTPPKKAAE